MNSLPEKIDYLKEDPPINGQEVVLISFVEPTEKRLLENKQSFMATRFLKGFIEEFKQAYEYKLEHVEEKLSEEIEMKLDISYDNIKTKYYDFLKYNLSQLETDFDKEYNEYKTPLVTGFKVRGVFPNQLVTKNKVDELHKLEPAINVFCAPVGKWIPYCPLNDREIESEYQTNELNELLKNKENEHIKNELEYEHRKLELMRKTQEENEMKKKLNEEEEEKNNVLVEEIMDELQKPEPKKEETKPEPKKRGRPKKTGNKRLVNKKK